MRPLIIFGTSDHARVVADAVPLTGQFSLLGFIDPKRRIGERVGGAAVIGTDDDVPALREAHKDLCAFVAIGENAMREKVAAHNASLPFATIVHPSAVLARDVVFGVGVFVAASATINCGVKIGDHSIVNTGACVDHDCVLEEFSFVSPGAVLAGAVRVGRGALVATGANVIKYVQIGDHAIVGAGATAIRNVAAGTTVVGVPARPIQRKTTT